MRKNDAKYQRSLEYISWEHIDMLAMALFESGFDLLRRVQPCSVSDDTDALRAIFQSTRLNQKHLARINAELDKPPRRECALRLSDNQDHFVREACDSPP